MSKEFMDLQIFHSDCAFLMNPDFWKLLFVMCRALYAPMRFLCLADLKTFAMDKLYYYVLQTDRMLDNYLDDVEDHATAFLTDATISAIDRLSSAGLSAASSVDTDADEDDNDDEEDDVFENEEEEVVDSDDEQ